jgi:hypothetical protein
LLTNDAPFTPCGGASKISFVFLLSLRPLFDPLERVSREERKKRTPSEKQRESSDQESGRVIPG